MFCPNCGKDCGDAKFCSSCGTKLQQNAAPVKEESGWKAGMPCPYCGATQLDGDSCAYCGARLIFNASVDELEEDSFELPVMYFCSQEITLDHSRILYNYSFLWAKQSAEIAYNEIEKVTYIRCGQKNDGLTIERTAEQNLRIVSTSDDDAIVYQLFCFLRTVAPSTAEFVLDDKYLDYVTPDQIMKRFDTDGFFNTYNPYRKRMRRKIRELTGMSIPDAEAVAAKVLYRRQEALYKENPSLAIRDLNRVIRECQREKEIKRQEREEQRRSRR